MKIAIIVSKFPTISQTFIVNQIVGLLEKGHTVRIFAPRRVGESKVHRIVDDYKLMEKTCYWLNYSPNKWGLRFRLMLQILHTLCVSPAITIMALKLIFKKRCDFSYSSSFLLLFFLRKQFDVVFCHFGPNGNLAVNIKKLLPDVVFVTMFHGYDTRMELPKAKKLYHALFAEADMILANSQYTYQRLIEFGAYPAKTQIHSVGINTSEFVPIDTKPIINEELIILSVGRLVPEKGIEYGIRAVADAMSKCRHKNLRYMIAGDGPLRKSLENLVSELHLKDKVEFLGSLTQDELKIYYQKADVFLLPSIAEAFGMVLLEAQAMKLPIVASNVGGVKYAVIENESALLVQPENIEQISEKLLYIINDSSVGLKMGGSGYRFVKKNYDIKKLNDRLERLLFSLKNDL
jgi:colanic acid/amylovoran biosynthesis glycosyltransferase